MVLPIAWSQGLSLNPVVVSLAVTPGRKFTPPSVDLYTITRELPPGARENAMHDTYTLFAASTANPGSPSASQPLRWKSRFADHVMPPSVLNAYPHR